MTDKPEGYLELGPAAVRGECSETTIRNQAAAGAIGKVKWKGRALYRADDIDAMVAKRKELTLVQNPGENAPVLKTFAQEVATALADRLDGFAARLEHQMQKMLPAPSSRAQVEVKGGDQAEVVPIADKAILTAGEARKLGFSRAQLRKVENIGSKDHRRFRRRDLDAL